MWREVDNNLITITMEEFYKKMSGAMIRCENSFPADFLANEKHPFNTPFHDWALKTDEKGDILMVEDTSCSWVTHCTVGGIQVKINDEENPGCGCFESGATFKLNGVDNTLADYLKHVRKCILRPKILSISGTP